MDELLFGHDWWTDKAGDLEALVGTHRGLQSARAQGALKPAGIVMPTPRKEKPKVARRSAPKLAASQIISRYRDLLSQPFGTIPEKPNETQRTPPTDFSWPSTEAVESRGGDNAYDLRARSRLKELGYDTNQSPSARWRILRDGAVPELGLARVAGLIAWFCRSRKQQKGGRQKYARAIAEWEHDLDRLRRELYPAHRSRFTWPRSEP